MNDAQTNTRIRRCSDTLDSSGCTIRRKVKSDAIFAFRLSSWLTFVREGEPHDEPAYQQLDLF